MAKILLIEDDSLIVKIYTTRLKADGHQIVSAEDGEKGLVMARAERPDIILLDVMMPKVDGFTVLEELRRDESFGATPIIMYSNLAQEAETKRALELGATEFITKANISPTELVTKLKTYLKPEHTQPAPTPPSSPAVAAPPTSDVQTAPTPLQPQQPLPVATTVPPTEVLAPTETVATVEPETAPNAQPTE